MSDDFPWYDSKWLRLWTRSRQWISTHAPDRLEHFCRSFDPLRTRPDFRVTPANGLLTPEAFRELRARTDALRRQQLEGHEFRSMGRFVVHDDPWISSLQNTLVDVVSRAVGEAVEPSYNFLCFYTRMGVCPLHLDSPKAKWTVDLCLDQSGPWPIHFSRVVEWPESFVPADLNWETWIRSERDLAFQSHTLEPGNAVIFSGSSQWHYRDPMPQGGLAPFCNLLFLHFIPAGTSALCQPKRWPDLFDLPGLTEIVS